MTITLFLPHQFTEGGSGPSKMWMKLDRGHLLPSVSQEGVSPVQRSGWQLTTYNGKLYGPRAGICPYPKSCTKFIYSCTKGSLAALSKICPVSGAYKCRCCALGLKKIQTLSSLDIYRGIQLLPMNQADSSIPLRFALSTCDLFSIPGSNQ